MWKVFLKRIYKNILRNDRMKNDLWLTVSIIVAVILIVNLTGIHADQGDPAYPKKLIYLVIFGTLAVLGFIVSRIVRERMRVPVLRCRRCGHENESGSQFCELCGHDLSKEKKEKYDPSKVIIEVIGAVVVIVTVYIVFSSLTDFSSEPTLTPSGTVESTTVPPSTTSLPTTPSVTTTVPPTVPEPTSPAPTPSPPPTSPPTTPSPSPSPTEIEGKMNTLLGDGTLSVLVFSVSRSEYGGYWIEILVENVTGGEVQWNPVEIIMVDSRGFFYDCHFQEPYSFVRSGLRQPRDGFKNYFAIPQTLTAHESFRLVLEFPAGRYLPKTFILTNEYADSSQTRWQIQAIV
jgi:hypothetical protein